MKKNSILFTINITFLISFILISISFIVLYDFNKKKEKHFNNQRAAEISKVFIHQYKYGGVTNELKENINSLDFSVISDANEIQNIVENKHVKRRKLKSRNLFQLSRLELEGKSFIYLQTPDEKILLKDDTGSFDDKSTLMLVYFVIVLILGFLYLSIIKKLKPLKALQKSVKGFGDENFDFNFYSSNEDEISQLSYEFELSAKKLKKIKESRNIFIRNIMHELKTPITKGKILTQLPNTDKNIESMQKVFYRLESLINEFASIEELIATKKDLQKKEYFLEDIIDNAIDILMCQEDEVIKEFDNNKLSVDFNIFSIAIKNLLDNGIKYSHDKKVTVKTEDNKLIFENVSSQLLYPLENYFEPFFRGDEVKSNQSFGLGLYIVKHILDAHSLTLEYEHSKGLNRFIILF